MNKEIRSFSAASANLQIRSVKGKNKISGYAIRYNQPANLGDFVEYCQAGMLTRTLRENPDVLLLRDHKSELLLGRTGVNLTLRDDAQGLYFEAELLDTTTAQDAYRDIKAGLLSGCSFGFSVNADTWSERNGQLIRTLKDVSLYEVSMHKR